jgi:hypothetical protein
VVIRYDKGFIKIRRMANLAITAIEKERIKSYLMILPSGDSFTKVYPIRT